MTKHHHIPKLRLLIVSSVLVAGSLLSACGSDSSTSDSETTVDTATIESTLDTLAGDSTEVAADCPAEDIVAAANAEAKVNLIALPDNWANYKGILQAFRDKYPAIKNPVANPDASSADELTAVKTLAGQEDMPDNLDVSPAIAQQVTDENLWEPYKP